MKKFDEIKTRNELADFLDIERKELTYILYVKHVDNLYKSFDILKKSGGVRHIHAPQKKLLYIQKRLANALYEYQKEIWEKNHVTQNISHAFLQGKSFITNAEIHRNKRFVVNIDLENFFDSFHFGRVRGYFLRNSYFQMPLEVATIIAQLSCYQGKLPQGAPSSPIITNLICNIFDMRVLKLAKKYRFDYTRYVDDLTFSSNDINFLKHKDSFFSDLDIEVTRAGFKINDKKTRIQYRDSRQEVTGLVVNQKLHVNREYYKKTRAMAHSLYKNGEYYIDGEELGTINQLEGRFSFINQLEWYNNKKYKESKHIRFEEMNGRELEYSKFIFYKYFFANPKPLIVTEGKTDIRYLKAAMKSLWRDYPELISKDSEGKFEYKVSFLRRSKRLAYFLNLKKDGADTMNNIYNFYFPEGKGKAKYSGYLDFLKKISNKVPDNAVILLFDNEIKNKEKPVYKFVKGKINTFQREQLVDKEWIILKDNLYLLMTPAIDQEEETDIEMLFDDVTLLHKIDGRTFTKAEDYDVEKYYGKEIFSKYIMKDYRTINFNGFRPLLDNIKSICKKQKEHQKF